MLWRNGDPAEDDAPVPAGSLRGGLVALAAAAVLGCVLFGSGWLLRPELPEGPYYVQMLGSRDGEHRYNGTMLVAVVGRMQIREGPLATSGTATDVIRNGGLLLSAVLTASAPESRTGLVTFYAPDGDPAAMLGVHHDDILYWQRLRASRFRLHSPAVRVPDVLEGKPAGDTLRLVTAAQPVGRCIQVDAVPYCQLGFTAGSGWALLFSDSHVPARMGPVLNAAWLGILLLPVGALVRPRYLLLILIAAVWYMVIRLPVDTVLLPAPWTDITGAVAGGMLGAVGHWWRDRRRVATHRRDLIIA